MTEHYKDAIVIYLLLIYILYVVNTTSYIYVEEHIVLHACSIHYVLMYIYAEEHILCMLCKVYFIYWYALVYYTT